ncbi:MAG TPA: hypothetical protein VFL57_20655 [Bryobacteraceae bacterium]|nr:hypothetical protein [Bryobacteraceae bacterium]
MQTPQPWLFAGDFSTGAPANPVFCHQDFLEKLAGHRNHPVGKRASLLLQRLAVDERRLHFKATHGVNRGWRRSRLGGNQGSHFYAWWAPRGAPPLRDGEGFASTPERSIFVRDIRHHDDHSAAPAQSLDGHYLEVSVAEMRREEYGPSPWTQPQARFAGARQAVRMLKGHPGSGKTTALLHAADQTGAEQVLYLTFSRELAALARLYFDRYCAGSRRFHVVTFDSFLRELLRTEAPPEDPQEARRQFRSDLGPIARSIAPWNDHRNALYDEVHAHIAGSALPIAAGRFEACSSPRVSERNYRTRRSMYIGQAAAAAAIDAIVRLEKADKRPVAERYFPELALAWRAGRELARPDHPGAIAPELLAFDCIAVDECQDLTALESFVVIQLAAAINRRRKHMIPLLLAGDEAQTVRPTDFEWAWMSEMLHTLLATPSEFRLSTNLRSPERIARLVNRVWDLYSVIEKRDRPSGTGYAEIEDDATDQILYCTAAPGPDLNELLQNLAQREGLALVTLDDEVPGEFPENLRRSILTVQEIKGLDFHSVCVLDGGRHLDRILKEAHTFTTGLDSLRKRLSIDALRVALSRPTERLLWLDIQPAPRVVQDSLSFLNYGVTVGGIAPSVPSAIVKTLDEEALDLEERIQRCQQDARQFLQIRPELALSRVNQAVALLGEPGAPAAITDESFRAAVYGMAAEICFSLAHRRAPLPPELGRPDLFREARVAALNAGRAGLAAIITDLERVLRARSGENLAALGDLVQTMSRNRQHIEPWLLTELGSQLADWVRDLEGALPAGDNAAVLSEILPPFYETIRLPDASERTQRLQERSVQLLMKNRKFSAALALLEKRTERDHRLEAACLDGLGRFAEAAEAFRRAGDLKEALRCYRSIPDFDTALTLIRDIREHPAAESYEWLARLRSVISDKPEKFNRVMQASEKKVLEEMLEQALGVARKKPAPKKATAKKTAPRAPAQPRPSRAPAGGTQGRGRSHKEYF